MSLLRILEAFSLVVRVLLILRTCGTQIQTLTLPANYSIEFKTVSVRRGPFQVKAKKSEIGDPIFDLKDLTPFIRSNN